MLTFQEVKRLAQETTNETKVSDNDVVADAMTRLMVKVFNIDYVRSGADIKAQFDMAKRRYDDYLANGAEKR